VFLPLDFIQVRKVDETHISVDISFCVLFLKSTMMKYIIERSTNGEMAKWLEVFFKHLKKVNYRYVVMYSCEMVCLFTIACQLLIPFL